MIGFFETVAFAQAAKEAPQQPGFVELIGMPLAFLVIMYLLVLRPQQKRQRSHQELLSKLKAGDEVVTTGGIIARIKSVSDQFVTVDAGGSTVLKVQKQHIAGFTEKANTAAVK
jgi:preprotein translocase subunit YajC